MSNALKFLTLLFLFPCFLTRKEGQFREFKLQGLAQGTTYSIRYFAKDSLVSKAEIEKLLSRLDSSMSLYKSYSTINKFNESKTGTYLDDHFVKVVQKSFEIYKDSGGLFDITIAPLVQYWGFGPKKEDVNSGNIAQILPNIGMNLLALQGSFLTKKKAGVHLDVNGIAQGYTVDVLADFFLKKGVTVFLIELGGEIRVNGKKPDGTLMKIGIEGPNSDPLQEPIIQHVVSFKDGAITTSGNYRNYLMKGKKKISHLIDPKTGYPLTNEMVSVTVFAPDAITADGYDNVLMAMPLKNALEFVAARKDLEAYFIYTKPDGKLADTTSVGFKRLMIN